MPVDYTCFALWEAVMRISRHYNTAICWARESVSPSKTGYWLGANTHYCRRVGSLLVLHYSATGLTVKGCNEDDHHTPSRRDTPCLEYIYIGPRKPGVSLSIRHWNTSLSLALGVILTRIWAFWCFLFEMVSKSWSILEPIIVASGRPFKVLT